MSVDALTAALERSLLAVMCVLDDIDRDMIDVYVEVTRRVLAQGKAEYSSYRPWRTLVDRWSRLVQRQPRIRDARAADEEMVEWCLGHRLAEGQALAHFAPMERE